MIIEVFLGGGGEAEAKLGSKNKEVRKKHFPLPSSTPKCSQSVDLQADPLISTILHFFKLDADAE